EPQGATHRIGGGTGQQCIECRLHGRGAIRGGRRLWRTGPPWLGIRHRLMTLHNISVQALSTLKTLGRDLHARMAARPLSAAVVLLGTGLLLGGALNAATVNRLQGETAAQAQSLEDTRREAQREVNALAARLAELQA